MAALNLGTPQHWLSAAMAQDNSDVPVTDFLRRIMGLPPMNANAASFDERFSAAPKAQGILANVPLPQPRPPMPAPPQAGRPSIDEILTSRPLPPEAQSAFARPAPQMAPQSPGFGDRLAAGGAGFFNAGSPAQSIGNLLGGLVTGQRQDPRGIALANQTQTARALFGVFTGQGMSPQQAASLAQVAAVNPKVVEELLKPPATMEAALARQAGGYGGQRGGIGQQQYMDFIRNKEAAQAGGRLSAEQLVKGQLELPAAISKAQEQIRLIETLRVHPGRDSIFWHTAGAPFVPDNQIPGNTSARDAVTLLNQIKGGAFLQAFQTLKGGGQITETEGAKATAAIARMERSQSRAEFDSALNDYLGVIRSGVDQARRQAGQSVPVELRSNRPSSNAPAPPPGFKIIN